MNISFLNQARTYRVSFVFISTCILLVVALFVAHPSVAYAQTEPYCTAGTDRDYSDRYCDWNSGIGEWECKTSYEGCVVERYTCGTSSCSVTVNYYCLVQDNGRDCYTEQETRTTSCTNDCDGTTPDPDPDPDPDPPPSDPDPEYQDLYVLKDGTGTGTVTSSPSGINCGSACSIIRSSTRRWDLTASAATSSTFTRWSEPQYTYNSSCGDYHWWGGCKWWYTTNTCGTLSQCRVPVSKGTAKTVTATFSLRTLYGSLTANPSSGLVGDNFTFTANRTGGTAIGTVTYATPRCVTSTRRYIWGLPYWSPTYSTPVSVSSGNKVFVCAYSSPTSPDLSHGGRVTINQGGVSRVVTATVPVGAVTVLPTVTASLTASDTLITRGDSSTLTWGSTNADSCTASPNFSGGTLSGSVDVSPTSNTTYRLVCQNAASSVERTVSVAVQDPPPPTLSVQLTGASGGAINQVLNFTASVSGTATGTPEYAPNCGGGTLSNWLDSTDRTFSCQYGSIGSKDVTVDVTRQGVNASATRTVSISEPTINAVDVEVDPQWIPRGGSTTVSWTTVPPNPGVSTRCSVNGDIPVSYSSRSSMPADNIDQATEFTVRCENDAPSSAEGSATVYILPSFSEF